MLGASGFSENRVGDWVFWLKTSTSICSVEIAEFFTFSAATGVVRVPRTECNLNWTGSEAAGSRGLFEVLGVTFESIRTTLGGDARNAVTSGDFLFKLLFLRGVSFALFAPGILPLEDGKFSFTSFCFWGAAELVVTGVCFTVLVNPGGGLTMETFRTEAGL